MPDTFTIRDAFDFAVAVCLAIGITGAIINAGTFGDTGAERDARTISDTYDDAYAMRRVLRAGVRAGTERDASSDR